MANGQWTGTRSIRLGLAAIALLAGCSSKTAPSKADSAPVVKVQVNPAPVVKKAARKDAGPDARTRPAESRAFFLREGNVLVPFLCWDAKAEERRVGAACLGLAHGKFALGNGQVGRIGRRKAASRGMGCDSAAGFVAGIKERPQTKVNPDKDNPPERHAVWPDTVQGLVKLVDLQQMKDKIEELPDDQRKAVMAQSREGAKIEGMIAEDLDGDGVEDRLYAVAFRSRDLEWRGILLQRGKDLKGIRVVKESEKNNFGLVGTLDIDGDGKREIWLEEDAGSGGFELVGELRGEGLVTLASFGCER